MLKTGEILKERYRIVSIIGEGGMSTVYLVDDLVLDSSWAVKETLDIFPDKDKKEIIEQFKKEAKILANLSHPNLPRVIDYFTESGKHYLVEEFIEGQPADDVLINSSSFEEFRILKWALQICDLLSFLHDNGIIYRDLKPGNILIDKNDNVHLVDFGIARFFHGGKARDTVIIGTPGFASPEHYGRGETDHRSDIYSLGATLHYMVTGVDPAVKPFHFEIPYFLNCGVSVVTSAIIMKCLELDPVRRYQKVSEVKEAIEKQAIPGLRKKTSLLRSAPKPAIHETYRNRTDFIGKTAQFLSYTSIFPATMGISGMIALGASFFGPIPAFIAGTASFPLLCIEFWKRFDQIYKDQESLIETEREEITYHNRGHNLTIKWFEVLELTIVKNRKSASFRRIKEVRVKTGNGEFTFDSSYQNYKRLIDTIITQSGLSFIEKNEWCSIYRRL
jgi:serine/threonine protein kinase